MTPIPDADLMPLLEDGAVVITANSRLPIELRRRHAEWRKGRDGSVWNSPRILPLAAWLDEAVDEAILAGRLPPDAAGRRVLSGFEERVLWERVIEREEEGGLMDLQSLAAAAQEANGLTRLYDIGFDALRGTEESRHFERWRQAFEKECRRLGLEDGSRAATRRLAWLADGTLEVPSLAVLAGYTETTPLEDAFRAAVLAAGGQVFRLEDFPRAARLTVQPCRDARAEVQAAADWAARRLQASEDVRLAIVVPDLAKLRTPLIRALDARLQPEAAWGAEAPVRLLNFSLGLPLAGYPLVAAALDVLSLLARPGKTELGQLGRLLRSSHWSDWCRENDARGRLERRLRRLGSVWIGLEQAAKQAGVAGAHGAARHLVRLAELQKEAGRKREGREWAELIPLWLEETGWPGSRALDSDEFQTREKFGGLVAALSGLDNLHPAARLSDWRNLLARQCREQVFQPQTRHRAYVEVLGPLEAVGQRFDGLWVMGLSDAVLPAAPRPNPLIPPAVQRERGLPHSSPEREQDFARALLAALAGAAPEVVLSHPRHEGDSDLRPSPLLAGLGAPAPAFEPPPPALPDPAPLFRLRDDYGPPLPPDAPLTGGSSLLAVQAQCPLAAFVRYRLSAEALKEPSAGPDASQRGTLLHLALAALWKRLKTQAALLALDEAGTRAAVDTAVAEALVRLEEEQPGLLGDRLAALEARRLASLILDWLELERHRPPFEVVAVEEERALLRDGLSLSLQLDRLDRLPDGGLVVLDYKTGKPDLKDWTGPRLLSPQLPLYARETEETGPLAGVGFARLRVGENAFLGAVAFEGILPGAFVPGQAAGRKRNPFMEWEEMDALLATWNGQLDGLAAEIREGFGANQAWVNDDKLRWLDAWPVLRRAGGVDDEGEESGSTE